MVLFLQAIVAVSVYAGLGSFVAGVKQFLRSLCKLGLALAKLLLSLYQPAV